MKKTNTEEKKEPTSPLKKALWALSQVMKKQLELGSSSTGNVEGLI